MGNSDSFSSGDLLRWLSPSSNLWKLLEGKVLELRSGNRVVVSRVELRGKDGPLISVTIDTTDSEQYNLRAFEEPHGCLARVWFNTTSDSDAIEKIRRLEREELCLDKEKQRALSVLKEYGVDHLEHITHADNLDGIFQHGVRARDRFPGPVIDIADSEVNARRARLDPIYGLSLQSYVPLYFTATNPMLSKLRDRLKDLVIIKVDVREIILSDQRWLITDGNAAADATKFFAGIDDLSRLDWQCLRAQYWNDIPDGKRKRCAEMLVEGHIPVEWIGRIEYFDCSASKIRPLGERLGNIEVDHRPDPFSATSD